jgi:hypothetical protein
MRNCYGSVLFIAGTLRPFPEKPDLFRPGAEIPERYAQDAEKNRLVESIPEVFEVLGVKID